MKKIFQTKFLAATSTVSFIAYIISFYICWINKVSPDKMLYSTLPFIIICSLSFSLFYFNNTGRKTNLFFKNDENSDNVINSEKLFIQQQQKNASGRSSKAS